MRSLAVTAQKGGVGKTTLAIHLAVAAARAGERVLVLDADPQGSCVTWSSLRDEEEPRVERVEPPDVPDRLRRAAAEGVTVVVVDTAPRASTSLAALLRSVDYAVVPLRPSVLDVATLGQSLAIIVAARRPGVIVLNACPPRAPEIAETRAAVAELVLPLAPVEVAERRAYGRALASGLAVAEFDPSGPAAAEMDALWSYVTRSMG
jgi:chromosome partitioning protein